MRRLFLIPAFALSLSGCLSMQSQGTLDNIASQTQGPPFIEAFIEYPGPAPKWSGPPGFVMHIEAKDAGLAQISVIPPIFRGLNAPVVHGRGLASAIGGGTPKGMTGDQARELMGGLANALQGAAENFHGCLTPVRVRLIQADGSILEKQGCRGQNGWARIASEAVNSVITASLEGPDAMKNAVPGKKLENAIEE